MKHHLNIKLLVFLGVGFVVAAVGTHVLHGYQVDRNAESLLERAEKTTDRSEEIRLLQRYLQYRQEDLTQLKRLLKLAKDEALKGNQIDWRGLGMVQRQLEKAVRENPEDIELQNEFLDLADQTYRVNDAQSALETLELLGAIEPRHTVIWAKCHARENRNDEAIEKLSGLLGYDRSTESFDASKATAPNELTAYVLLRGIYQSRLSGGDRRIPALIMNQMVEQNQDNAEAYRLRANFLRSTVDEDPQAGQQALADMDKALSLAPKDINVIIDAVRTKLLNGDMDGAQELLKTGLEEHPDHPRVYEFLSMIAADRGDFQGAIDQLNLGLGREALTMNPFLMWIRCDRELDLQANQKAEETFNRIRGRMPVELTDFLLARMNMADGDHASAAKILDRLRPKAPKLPYIHSRVDIFLEQCYRRLGQDDKVQELAKSNPSSTTDTRFRQAEELVRVGRFSEAFKLFQDIYKDEDSNDASKGRALLGLYNVGVEEQKLRPAENRDWTRVDKIAAAIVQQFKSQGKGQYPIVLFEINHLINKGEKTKAKERVEAAKFHHPEVAPFWLILNQLTNNNERGLKLLSQMRDRFGDVPQIRIAMASRIAVINGPNVDSELASLLENMSEFKPIEQTHLKRVIADKYSMIGNFQRAIEIYRELKAANNADVRVSNDLFLIALATGNEQLMDEMLQDYAATIGEDSSDWKVAMARKMLWQIKTGQVDKLQVQKIRTLLEEAENQRPDWAVIPDLRAKTFVIEGKTNDAIRTLNDAFQKHPRNYVYPREMANILIAAGRTSEAKRYLDVLPDAMKSSDDMRTELRILVATDPKTALERIRILLENDKEHPQLLLLLSQVQERLGSIDDSLSTMRDLIKVAPEQTQVWLRFVGLLQRNGKTQEAERALKDIQKSIVNEIELALLMGQCNALLNRLDDAKKWYRNAIKLDPDNTVVMRNIAQMAYATGDLQTGEQFFDKILQVQNKTPETLKNQIWCRREKAKMLTRSQTFQDFQQAIQLLELNADEFGKLHDEDLRYWLTFHANRSERSYREKALKRLVTLQRERQLTPVESIIQAELNKVDGRWSEARSIMLDLMARQQNNATIIAKYVDWLVERKEIAEASTWLTKLDPNSPIGLRLYSLVLVHQGKSKEAAKRLLALVPANLPKEESRKVRDVAQMFTELGKHNRQFYGLASKQWKRYVALNPEAKMAYVDFLLNVPGKSGITAGLDLANKLVASAAKNKEWGTVLQYASLAINGLQNHKEGLTKDSSYVKVIDSWLALAKSANTNSPDVLWNEAMLADVIGDEQTLETNYRQLLRIEQASDIRKGIAANNLAYLLATTNRADEAIAIIEQAFKILGYTSDLHDTRAMAFIAKGDYRNAIKDLNKVIEAGEATAQIYFHLALAESKNGDADNAKTNINKAIEQGLEESELTDREAVLFKSLLRELQISIPTAN